MKEKFQKIFITVGTTRFDRLIESLLLPNVISVIIISHNSLIYLFIDFHH